MSLHIFSRELLKHVLASCMLLGSSALSQPLSIKEPANSKATIVMLGDSITQAGTWATLLNEHRVINRGVAGYTTGDLLREVNETIALKPTKIFLMIGINDLLRGASVEQTFKTYASLVTQLRASGAQLYLQSTLECARAECGKTVESVQELNRKLRALASSMDLIYIDLNVGLTKAPQGLLPQYTWDGLHLSKSAYNYWAAHIKPYLQSSM